MVSLIFLITWGLTIYFGITLISPLWYFIVLYVLTGYLIGVFVLVLLLILLMPIMKITKNDSKLKYYLAKSAATFINIFILRAYVTSEGKENIPKKGKLTVYANHKSQTDPILLMPKFNRGLAFTPKISLYKIPILSNYMNYIGCLPIDRDDNRRTARTMIQAIKNVEKGHAMLIFPEGGIKSRDTESMVDIRGGAYKIGEKSKSDFLPITIKGATKFNNRKWWQIVKVHIVIHPVVKYEDVKDLNTLELGKKMFDIINSSIEE